MNSSRPLIRWFQIVLTMLGVALVTPAARALVVYGGVTGHTTNPGYGLPWDNVGNTGVYLGAFDTGHWVITANHVGAAGITLDGVAYSGIGGSAVRIGTTDLLLYRIDVSLNGAPDLANLTISGFTPSEGGTVVMQSDGSGVMTWGVNTIEGYGNYALTEGGPTTVGLITDYDAVSGESQGQGGDSGGAVFFQHESGQWWLSGIISAIGTFAESGTAFTASVAVAAYYDEIIAIVGTPIPEPSAGSLIIGGVIGACVVLVRRRCRTA